MRKLFLSIVVAAVVVALFGPTIALAKAHVPLGRAQVCTQNGSVKNVSGKALSRLLGQDACRLTACVFNDVEDGTLVQQFIFLPGDDCDPTDDDGDGFCDATGAPKDIPKRLKAVNVTTACTDPF